MTKKTKKHHITLSSSLRPEEIDLSLVGKEEEGTILDTAAEIVRVMQSEKANIQPNQISSYDFRRLPGKARVNSIRINPLTAEEIRLQLERELGEKAKAIIIDVRLLLAT